MAKRGPSISIHPRATWTLRALAGGYAKGLTKQGLLTEFAEPNPYKVLVEGLESFLSMTLALSNEDDRDRRYGTTPEGRTYLTSRG